MSAGQRPEVARGGDPSQLPGLPWGGVLPGGAVESGISNQGKLVINLNRPHWLWEGPIFSYGDTKESRVAGGVLTCKLNSTLVINYH